MPVISVDCMWLKGKKEDGEEESKGNPILVMHCRGTKLTWSRVVLKKGVGPCSFKVLSDMIVFTGHKKSFLKERRGARDQGVKRGSEELDQL